MTRLRAVCIGNLPNFHVDEVGIHNHADVGGKSSNKCKGKLKGPNVKADKPKGPKVKTANSKGPVVERKKKKDKPVNVGGRGHKSDPNKVCCPWVILVSKERDAETWIVRTLVTQHKCLQTRSVYHCTSTFLSKQLMQQIEENPSIPVKAVQEQFQRKFEIGISRMKAFRAKRKALSKLHGDYQAQYTVLRDYCGELLKTNPGSTIHIEVESCPDPTSDIRKFKRIYICLGSLKQGFNAIGRPLLGLDGAFVKGPYPGQVLSAVGVDRNNGIYPLAYAVLEAETINSWTWFLQCLGDDINLQSDSYFTFISDRQKVSPLHNSLVHIIVSIF